MRLRTATLFPAFALTLAGAGLTLGSGAEVSADAAARDAAPQDPQDEDEVDLAPFTSWLEEERLRREQEIAGSWNLISLETTSEFVDPADFRGFAQFHDGYLTFLLMGAEADSWTFGPGTVYTLLSGVYRYRVSHEGTLQIASMMGFDNLDGDFAFHRTGDALEFELSLEGDDLVLNQIGANRYEYRRLRKSAFPERAAERLRAERGGIGYDEDDDPVRGGR